MEKFSAGTFGMFGGKETPVRMEFENRFVGVVLDRFGQDVMLIPRDEKHFFDADAHQCQSEILWLAGQPWNRGSDHITGECTQRIYIIYEEYSDELWRRIEYDR